MNEMPFIESLLDEAADLVASRYGDRQNVSVTSKVEPNDLLTEVDLAVQRLLVERIQAEFPDDRIVGEEDGFNEFPADPNVRAWVLDPIDGTQNFVRGLFPAFGVSIAFVEGNQPVAGGVKLPMTGQCFTAAAGQGAKLNGAPIRVSTVDDLERARIEIDFSTQPDREETLARFSRIFVEGGQVRCHCAAVVPLVSIAAGEMDVYLHVTLNPWDFAAGMLLVQEAGGRVSRLNGEPVGIFDGKRGFAASNGLVHDDLLSRQVTILPGP
jgi:myo-inositol-1(or 4)-monophosphatase